MTSPLASALEGGRGAYGLVQLGRPDLVGRILGARLLVQAVGTALAADRLHRHARGGLHALGGAVDVLHGTSMLGLALVCRRRRGWALRQAAGAAVLAAGELALAVSCSRHP
ncbi:hypothetical protein [Ornithinimicrobium avium]|uniref:hypothetical protein n=1 Tax=Ornithinimicrobium avium TaxID=2283195 RepID=UPI0013B47392|nr:hypothetical protein [Ornithinimicrobium avium]